MNGLRNLKFYCQEIDMEYSHMFIFWEDIDFLLRSEGGKIWVQHLIN